jgi:hypothetical protein
MMCDARARGREQMAEVPGGGGGGRENNEAVHGAKGKQTDFMSTFNLHNGKTARHRVELAPVHFRRIRMCHRPKNALSGIGR